MSTISFDTLAYAKKLIAAGVPATQAEVQAEALKEIIDDNLATKRDLKEMELRLKYDLTVRFGIMAVAIITITVSLIKFIH